MNKSETIAALAAALNKAQSEMGGAVKDANNPFFNSKYADLSAVVKAIKEPFADNGLSYAQFPVEDNGRIGVETILMHESGEFLSQLFTVQLAKQDAQGAGSAITYCRRYALQAIAGIPSEDDDGNAAQHQGGAHEEPEKPWYNDFEAQKATMIEHIANGKTPDQIITSLRKNFKLSTKVADQIKGLQA